MFTTTRTRRLITRLYTTSIIALTAGHAAAQCDLTKLMHADRASFDSLGAAMSMSSSATGPMVAVGMPDDDTAAGLGAGSIRFFLRLNTQWGEGNWLTLQAADAAAGDHFGRSVSYRDPYLIVGAPDAGTAGAAYIYKRFGSSWVQEARVVPPGAGAGDLAGQAVAISGDWAVLSSPMADYDGNANAGVSDPNSGAAYFYRRQANGTWVHTQTVRDAASGVLSYFAADDHFGSAVDIDGAVAVIGIPDGENVNWPDNHGYIHTYRLNASNVWVNDNDVLYSAPGTVQADDHYGASVSVDGDWIAVGAPDDDAAPGEVDVGSSAKTNSGCVFIRRYVNGGWVNEARLMPPDASDNARFGASVSLGGYRCLITAPGARKAYIYQRNSGEWELMNTIHDPDTGFSSFASGCAFDGDTAVIGDTLDSANNISSGGAIYTVEPLRSYGDTCDAAGLLLQSGTVAGCTTLAQADSVTTCGGGGANGYGPDVWYSYYSTCSGPVTIDTNGSTFDTVLSLHSSCPGGGGSNTIACDDDSGPGTTSLISRNFAAGEFVMIRISGYNGASGEFLLNITHTDAPANDTCTTPAVVSSGNSYAFATCGANTTALGVSCLPGTPAVKDVWYLFNAPAATGTLKLNTCGSNFDTILTVYNTAACPTIANEIACNDDTPAGGACGAFAALNSSISTSIQGGFPYLVRVSGFLADEGTGSLRVDYVPNCHCDWNASGALSVQDIFDFLAGYFSGNGDFNQSGATTVQDIFDFLACYFGGC